MVGEAMLSGMQIRDFQLERYFGLYEFSVRHQLSVSDCESCEIAELLELAGEAQDSLLSLKLGYTESRGDPKLRAAIAEHYDECGADDVVVTNAGIYGAIAEVEDNIIWLEVAPEIELKVSKTAIVERVDDEDVDDDEDEDEMVDAEDGDA